MLIQRKIINIIYERERLLIHLVEPTTTEERLHNMTRLPARLYLFKDTLMQI